MTTEKFIPYSRQSIDDEDIQAVVNALKKDIITRGEEVAAFEYAVCDFTKAKYAVAFSSGSAALYAAYQALSAGPLDSLITTPNTFIATVAHGRQLGMALRYSDIDQHANMDFSTISDAINTCRSRGRTFVVPVHFAGVACNMAQLDAMIKTPHIAIIEDAAHAFGSLYPDSTPVGSCLYSDMTIFSFHPAKNITTGEGGIVTTNDEVLKHRLIKLRNSGIERDILRHTLHKKPYYYEVDEISCNYHMTEFQAALGRAQLSKIHLFRKKKAQLVALYREKLKSLPGITLTPSYVDSYTHYHLFVIHVAFKELGIDRAQFMEKLQKRGIGSQYHYVPLYYHPALGPAPCDPATEFPEMERHFASALSIPLYASMTEEDINRVVHALRCVIVEETYIASK